MSRVLVTGSSGLVGSEVVRSLAAERVEIVPFDLTNGRDILDSSALADAVGDCDAIVHAAALLQPVADFPDRLWEVNVDGTGNVLEAARTAGVGRIVFVSTAAVLGVFQGRRPPDYLPLDLDHPCYASTEYEESKLAAERLCAAFASSGAGSAVSLRVPGVWSARIYREISRLRRQDPAFEAEPYWEFGAFIDVRDLANACHAATTAELEGHVVLLLSSSDVSTSGPTSREWVARVHPSVPWRGGDEFDEDPYRTLVRIDEAREVLGWEPEFTWRAFLAGAAK